MTTLSCPHCGFSKDFPADKLPNKATQVTCPSCRKAFAFTPPAAEPAQPAVEPPKPAAAPPAPATPPEQKPKTISIACPHCQHRREVPRDKVPQKQIRVTCPACRKPFPFDGSRIHQQPEQPAAMHPLLAASAKPAAPPRRRRQLAGIGELFRRSWQVFSRRILTLVGINLLGLAMAAIAYLLLGGVFEKLQKLSGNSLLVTIPAMVILALFSLAVGSAIAGGMTYAVIDEELGVRVSLGYGIHRWRSFFWLFTLLAFILGGGFILFFIPGLLLTVWFIFAQFVLANEDVGGMDALLMSRAYVRGHGWAVLGRILLLAVINMALSIIPVVGIVFALLLAPFTLIYYYEIYRDLHEIKAPVICNNSRGEKAKYLAIGAVGQLLVPIVLLILAAPVFYQGLDLLQKRLGLSLADSVQVNAARSAHKREGKPLIGSLLLKKFSYAPGESIHVTYVAPPGLPKDAWIGIVPSDIPHGDEVRNDRHDLAYQHLEGHTSATLQFEAPQEPGDYDLRMNDTDSHGREIASIPFHVVIKPEPTEQTAPAPQATQPPPTVQPPQPQQPAQASGPQLRLERDNYVSGEAITLHFSGLVRPALTDRIALFLVGSDNSSPVESKYLGQKAEGDLHFMAPPLPGSYEFRLFRADNSAEAIASSPAITVAAQ